MWAGSGFKRTQIGEEQPNSTRDSAEGAKFKGRRKAWERKTKTKTQTPKLKQLRGV